MKGRRGYIYCLILLVALYGTAVSPEVKPDTILMRYHSYPTYTRIVLEGNPEILQDAKVLSGTGMIIVEFQKGGSLKPSNLSINDGMVKSVEFRKMDGNKTLNVILEKTPSGFKTFLLKDPDRRVIDIYRATTTTITPTIKTKTVIVIDPGHGGPSPGAIGPSGLQEKAITLDIALKLRALFLRYPEFKIILTRGSDFSVPLRDRAAQANINKSDLFLSLHVDSSFGKSKRPFKIFLSELKGRPDIGELINTYLWDIQQEKSLEQSMKLAETLKEALKRLNWDIKIREAPLLVLMGVEAPAVLVEIPSLMNPEVKKALRDESFKMNIASSLLEGVINYKRTTLNDQARF